MRLRAILFATLAFAAAGAAAWKVAERASTRFEHETATDLALAFGAAGQSWVHAETDGLIVILTGAAPDETSRVKALEIGRAVVAGGRIRDETTVVAVEPLPPPPFALEILRNGSDVSLIGLVPDSGGRDVIRAALGAGGLDEHVTDMLETAGEPAPDGWQAALGFGLSVLSELPRAKISVAPGEVKVAAAADSDAARTEIEARLRLATPQGVRLTLAIGAPRPVITPFALDFIIRDGKAHLGRCSAGSGAAAAAIIAAARAAGVEGEPVCPVGFGAPSPDWAAAMVRGIEAVKAMGGGRFVASDIAVTLTGAPGMTDAALRGTVSELRKEMPAVFQISSVAAPQMAPGDAGEAVDAPDFRATLARDGAVRLAGPAGDAASREAVVSYAAALFTQAQVTNAMVIDPDVPPGWTSRLLAAVEALSALDEGAADVTGDRVKLTGWSLDRDVPHEVRELLAAKVGAGGVADVTYNAAAAEAAARTSRPRPEICAEQIDAILDAEQIGFAKGSADIVPESRGVIGAIADVLRGCPGVDFEIGGHTDSQGSPEGNRRLSEGRAQAVLAALRAQHLPQVGLVARGFGADDPVADNATEEGRARNRRIEFTLVAPEPLGERLAGPAPGGAESSAESSDGATATAGGCAATINRLVEATPIEFEPGSSTLAAGSRSVIAAIAKALRACPDAAIEVGGHTDSQGSDEGNLRLSEARTEAVLAALRAPDLPLPNLVAHGYGEADPVADNATEEGRARNRRIAFTPVAQPVPTPEAASAKAAAAAGPGEDEAADTAPGTAADTAADTAAAACVAEVQARIDAAGIAFAPGSSEIDAASRPVIAAMATELRTCPDVAIEVGGHTDSQGSEDGNARLSAARAEAVLAALRAEGIPLPNATAKGYGESQPIADNATAEGRERNRRIEVRLADEATAPADGGSGAGDGSGDGGDGPE